MGTGGPPVTGCSRVELTPDEAVSTSRETVPSVWNAPPLQMWPPAQFAALLDPTLLHLTRFSPFIPHISLSSRVAWVADFGCGLSGGNGVQDEQVLATVPLCHLREEHRCAQEASPPPRALTTLSSPARSRDPRKWTVQLGELTSKPTRWNLQAYHNRYRVEDIISNPLARGVLSDIALLKLASSVTYSRNIQPVCVLSSTFMFQHRPDCWVTGWGALSENKKPLPPPYLLREVQVAILNTTRCRDLFRIPSPLSVINNDTICAGSEDGSVDTCSVSVPIPPGSPPPTQGL
ncbi:serine protease 41-like [Castor canadensis]|uniref:Serine protease 41-like n=1 Tax=Castor canadensis TaxID=51338 RepID=A0AC58LGS6_CASCN